MPATKKALDETFFALADTTRREMLSRLARGPATVGELGKPFKISAPAVSKHLKILERAGLIKRLVSGRTHEMRIVIDALSLVSSWISDQRNTASGRLDELEALLRSKRRAPKRRR